MNKERTFYFEECQTLNASQPNKKSNTNLKGPVRVFRLCLLGILFPAIVLAVPLYLRYRVYNPQLYPLAMSDMRLIDSKVSTTWCQRQLVKVNTSFNAFLLSDPPTISTERKPLSMVRHLILEDDTKEYWGFYLLQGSSVTISTCVRWPGASLIVIRGHKHLHECAYIGDNSSEEIEELMEAIREKSYVPTNPPKNIEKKAEQPVNDPSIMKRYRPDVEFYYPLHATNSSRNFTINKQIDDDSSEMLDDPREMKKILEQLQMKTKIAKRNKHVIRNSTVAIDESKYIKIQPPIPIKSSSKEVIDEIIEKLESVGNQSYLLLRRINDMYQNGTFQQMRSKSPIDLKGRHYSKPPVEYNDNIDRAKRRKRELILSTASRLNQDDEGHNLAIEENFKPDGIADHRGTINETTPNDMSNSEFWSSFSSSEEALLNCAGLILNLPLSPHHRCTADLPEEQAEETYLVNTVTYKVPANGYYFFVFNSENEVQPNYIRVHFHLQKTVYNVSNPVATCSNTNETCAMDLKFFSSQKLILELPVRENNSLWNEEFVVISECEPRSAVYVICVVAVPVFVILFAFS